MSIRTSQYGFFFYTYLKRCVFVPPLFTESKFLFFCRRYLFEFLLGKHSKKQVFRLLLFFQQLIRSILYNAFQITCIFFHDADHVIEDVCVPKKRTIWIWCTNMVCNLFNAFHQNNCTWRLLTQFFNGVTIFYSKYENFSLNTNYRLKLKSVFRYFMHVCTF